MRARLAVALALLVAGGLLLGEPGPAARACTFPVPIERIPASRATERDRQRAIAAGPDYVDVVRLAPLPVDAVAFEGTASAFEVVPDPGDPAGGRRRARWTFTVERVVRGRVGPEAVIVDPAAGSPCGGAHYASGTRQRVVARRDSATGELRPLLGAFDVPWGQPAEPPAVVPPRGDASPARLAASVTLAFLAVIGALGIALIAAGTFLQAKALELQAREPAHGAPRPVAESPLRWPPDAP